MCTALLAIPDLPLASASSNVIKWSTVLLSRTLNVAPTSY